MKTVHNILFDLDGTLTDSAEGIIHAYAYSAKKLGITCPPRSEVMRFVGDPLRDNLASFVPADRVEEAVEYYLHCYDQMRFGLTENRVYDGVIQMLTALHDADKTLYVVTAKLEELALPILSRYGLEPFFKNVYAAARNGTDARKSNLITQALASAELDPSSTVMIGDRSSDIVGAHQNGIWSIGVTWGYGSVAELSEAKPDALAGTPEELVGLLID